MNICQLPPPLKPNDLLRVIAPSGALRELDAFHKGVNLWRSRGYRVELSSGFNQQWGYLAGTDDNRRQQLRDALNDSDCRGMLCARGGYGGARLLEDWSWQGSDPKWLIGFSDITALLISLGNHGISGLHGALLTTISAEPDWSLQRLFDWVEGRPIQPLNGTGWGTARQPECFYP